MSNQPERPWTEEEKYALLTEILKKAGVHSGHLVKMIKDFQITPSWADIPLPSGRSLNSCQMAFQTMYQHHMPPSMNPGSMSFAPPRPESSAPSGLQTEGTFSRKRPLFPLEKPALAPRAIQPRPPTSATSYSSESGASTHMSPSLENITSGGEPPRKRGRPSKAETERRRAAAEARGETYPPPRRSGSGKLKIPSTPTSPAGPEATEASLSHSANIPTPDITKADVRYASGTGRGVVPGGIASAEEQARTVPKRDIGPTAREPPRPSGPGHPLPIPQALQLGSREEASGMSSGERPFDPVASERGSLIDIGRQNLKSMPSARCDQRPAPISEGNFRSSTGSRESVKLTATFAEEKT